MSTHLQTAQSINHQNNIGYHEFVPLAQPEADLISKIPEQLPSKQQVIGSSPIGKAKIKCFSSEDYADFKEMLRLRDGDNCYLCSRYIDPKGIMDELPTIDHVYPRSLGGPNDLWNLRLAHKICNSIKANSIDADQIAEKIKTERSA